MGNKDLAALIENVKESHAQFKERQESKEDMQRLVNAARDNTVKAWDAVYDALCEIAEEQNYRDSPFKDSKIYHNLFKKHDTSIHVVGSDEL